MINIVRYTENNSGHPFDYHLPKFNFFAHRSYAKDKLVMSAKAKLNKLDFYHSEINDIYTKETEIAVANFQKFKGITVDGILGPETFKELKIDL